MALSWNEIKDRALHFSKEWADTSNEDADAKPFLDAFFDVFGVPRKKIGTFEHKVKKINDADGYIDLLWKGTILIEMKSRGKNLDRAFEQAKDYALGLKAHELPKYILVSDFFNFRLYDTEEKTTSTFQLPDFVNHVQLFGFISGYQKKTYKEQDPANIKAAELMGKLHDRLEEIGYTGHPLEVYLVRILFCLFAEDTTIFDKQQFQDFIEQRTAVDGSDLAARIQELFQVLNTPKDKRFKNLNEQLAEFPYVNGKLFEEILPTASFDTKMRQALLDCCYIDWSLISPAIFGSMFQSVMNPKERRNLGAHYTSETNILKLIKPLFLDELWSEFHNIKDNKNKLPEFHKKLSTLKFLDPACGCGNFLVITYRELRLLELEILRAQYKNQLATSIEQIIWLDVDQVYGIEYEEFPARIAEVAMWLMDHQMNMQISQEFGQYFVRLPLKKSAKIVHGNALEMDWEDVVEKNDLNFILGNPPFIGYAWQSESQKNDMASVFSDIKGSGVLDYVSAWYLKSAKYIQETKIKVAFVSTNSISQGEQPAILWQTLISVHNIFIHFAHRTFSWSNEAKGNAAVHVVIIGFANFDISKKLLFEYENIKGEPHEIIVSNINPYLVAAKNVFIQKRTVPICNVPGINRGSDAIDDGNLLLSKEEKDLLCKESPEAEKYVHPFLMGREFLNNIPRYCLWFKNAELSTLRNSPKLYERINKVKEFRQKSKRIQTLKAAQFPSLFGEERQPDSDYLAIPKVSSENRVYIPIGFCDKNIICGDKLFYLPNANSFHFGIITSKMHMVWVKNTCGRLKSDYSYSNTIVYNNFPWPDNPSETQVKNIEEKAQKVLDVRLAFPNSSLADLYDPLTMPPALVKAHNDLDKAVDQAYRSQPFTSEGKRMEFLFELYEKYTADLFTKEKKKKK
jgi:type I restriction-modification system DNA methylase subunit